MATISLTDIVFNTDLESATVNSIFSEIESFLNGSTASADITITGTMTAAQFQTAVDGTAVAADGSYTMGASDDAGIYWDGTEVVLDVSSALTSTPQYLTIKHTTSGTPASGIGIGLKYIVETSAGNNETGAILDVITTDVTGASEDFDFVIKLMTGGAVAAEVARFQSDGKLDLVSGSEYQINGTDVLSATVLGTGVVTSSLTTVGALDSGSITSGFGAIDNGASAITTTGLITGGNLTVDNLNVNGNTISSTSGDINITPVSGSDFVIDSQWEFDANTITGLVNNDLVITAFAGRSINVELTEFDGGLVTLGSLGTVSSPSIRFTGDGNTGIYSTGADKIGFTTGGVNRLEVSNTDVIISTDLTAGTLFVDSVSEEIGFGTIIPDKPFHFEVSNALTTAMMKLKQASTGDCSIQMGTSVTNWILGVDNSDSDKFVIGAGAALETATRGITIESTGIVSIGAVNSTAQLTIDQSSTTAAIPVLELDQGDSDQPIINFVGAAAATTTASISTLNTSGSTTDHIQIEINGTKAWIAVSTNNPS